jgi:hypothetical protein
MVGGRPESRLPPDQEHKASHDPLLARPRGSEARIIEIGSSACLLLAWAQLSPKARPGCRGVDSLMLHGPLRGDVDGSGVAQHQTGALRIAEA